MNTHAEKVIRKKQKPESVGEILRNISITPDFDQRLTEELLFKQWPRIVGSFLAKKTRPQRVLRGILFIDVESSALANMLHYMQRELIDKITAHISKCKVVSLKCKVVSDLEPIEDQEPKGLPNVERRVKIDVKISQRLKEALENISDPDIRESLRRLILYSKNSL